MVLLCLVGSMLGTFSRRMHLEQLVLTKCPMAQCRPLQVVLGLPGMAGQCVGDNGQAHCWLWRRPVYKRLQGRLRLTSCEGPSPVLRCWNAKEKYVLLLNRCCDFYNNAAVKCTFELSMIEVQSFVMCRNSAIGISVAVSMTCFPQTCMCIAFDFMTI